MDKKKLELLEKKLELLKGAKTILEKIPEIDLDQEWADPGFDIDLDVEDIKMNVDKVCKKLDGYIDEIKNRGV